MKICPLLLSALLAFPFSLHAADAPATTSAADDWQSIKVDSYKLAYKCEGKGSPVLVLQPPSGLSTEQAFAPILPELAKRSRVCYYERVGFGKSSKPAAGFSQTAQDYSRELGLVLNVAAPKQKYVVIGYSFGGFVARHFAGSKPDSVLGLVLIDAAHEDWISDMKVQMQAADWERMQWLLDWYKKSLAHNYWDSQEQIRKTRLAPDLPVRIISRGLPFQKIRQAKLSDEGVNIYNALHDKHQFDLLKLSNATSRVVAHQSEHLILDSEPALVLGEIDILLKQLDQAQAKPVPEAL